MKGIIIICMFLLILTPAVNAIDLGTGGENSLLVYICKEYNSLSKQEQKQHYLYQNKEMVKICKGMRK